MDLSRKLNFLQDVARKHIKDSKKLYLIEMLAEHAEEEKMTLGFLNWVRILLEGEIEG